MTIMRLKIEKLLKLTVWQLNFNFDLNSRQESLTNQKKNRPLLLVGSTDVWIWE